MTVDWVAIPLEKGGTLAMMGAMLWIRTILYVLPLVIIFSVVMLFREVSRFELEAVGGALTTSIGQPIGPIDPLLPIEGPAREVRDLIFEPPLLRDDDLKLRPHLFSEWEMRTVVVMRCLSEEAAGEAEARVLSGEYLDEGMTLQTVSRTGSVLTVALEGFDLEARDRFVGAFDEALLGDYLLVRLRLKHSIKDSFGTYLDSSVEKGQIRMVDYEGDEVANLFVRGDTDLFLRELQLYYESNRGLDPEIEVVGAQCYTCSQELFIKLRADAKWHDGEPVTADDVLFSYEELTRESSRLPMKGRFWFVNEVEKIDDFSLRMLCHDFPVTMMESFESLPILPHHLLSDPSDQGRWQRFAEHPVGFGPYQFDHRREDGGIILRAFVDYFGPVPKQEWNVYRRFDSLESKLLALRSERVDSLFPDERFRDWADRNPGEVREVRGLPRIQYLVAWNLEAAPLNRVEVRRALAHAIDVAALLADAPVSYQEPVTSVFFPGSHFVSRRMRTPEMDLKKARELLQKAGYRFNEDHQRWEDQAQEVFNVRLSVNVADRELVRFAKGLQEQWQDFGVVVEVEEIEWGTLIQERLMNREFQGALLSWEIPLKRDRYETFHSQGVESGSNLFGLKNKAVDRLLERLRYEERPKMVSAYAHQFQDELLDLQPCLFLAQEGRIVTIRRDGVKVDRPSEKGVTGGRTLNIGKSGLERSRPWWVRWGTSNGVEMREGEQE